MTDEHIRLAAIQFAKKNKERIAIKLTEPAIFAPDPKPISVFMAGSPGAGKTEFSKWLIEVLEDGKERQVVRIDGDEIRSFFTDYTGTNSRLFQGAVSLIVEKVHDLVLHNNQSFVLDGTCANYDKAEDNIGRSLGRARGVMVFYIYQKPEVAWKFTQARELAEGRNIPKSAFIEQFLGAQNTVNKLSREFSDKITVFFVKKDFEKNLVEKIVKIEAAGIDAYIDKRYTKTDLGKFL